MDSPLMILGGALIRHALANSMHWRRLGKGLAKAMAMAMAMKAMKAKTPALVKATSRHANM